MPMLIAPGRRLPFDTDLGALPGEIPPCLSIKIRFMVPPPVAFCPLKNPVYRLTGGVGTSSSIGHVLIHMPSIKTGHLEVWDTLASLLKRSSGTVMLYGSVLSY